MRSRRRSGRKRSKRSTHRTTVDASDELAIHERHTIPFSEIAKAAFTKYPKRAVLCLALFVGQAFLYNGITFNLGTLMSTYFDVASNIVPVFLVFWAISNFLGPVILGRLFDTVGRKPMISLSYIGSAAVAVALAFILVGSDNEWLFLIVLMVCFFLASSGASAAYLTVSEIFPMETRALAIAFFYAIGTGLGGIAEPLTAGDDDAQDETP